MELWCVRSWVDVDVLETFLPCVKVMVAVEVENYVECC